MRNIWSILFLTQAFSCTFCQWIDPDQVAYHGRNNHQHIKAGKADCNCEDSQFNENVLYEVKNLLESWIFDLTGYKNFNVPAQEHFPFSVKASLTSSDLRLVSMFTVNPSYNNFKNIIPVMKTFLTARSEKPMFSSPIFELTEKVFSKILEAIIAVLNYFINYSVESFLITVFTLSLYAMYRAIIYGFNIRFLFTIIILIVFWGGFFWNWYYLYKEAVVNVEVSKMKHRDHHKEIINPGLLKRFLVFLGFSSNLPSDAYYESYKNTKLDPASAVSPTKVLSITISGLLTEPLIQLAKTFSTINKMVFGDSIWAQIIGFPMVALVFGFLYIFHCLWLSGSSFQFSLLNSKYIGSIFSFTMNQPGSTIGSNACTNCIEGIERTQLPASQTPGQSNEPRGQTGNTQGRFASSGQTNIPSQGQTNQPQGQTNQPQGQTNRPQGQTNQPQGQTNQPQGQFASSGQTNIPSQGQTESERPTNIPYQSQQNPSYEAPHSNDPTLIETTTKTVLENLMNAMNLNKKSPEKPRRRSSHRFKRNSSQDYTSTETQFNSSIFGSSSRDTSPESQKYNSEVSISGKSSIRSNKSRKSNSKYNIQAEPKNERDITIESIRSSLHEIEKNKNKSQTNSSSNTPSTKLSKGTTSSENTPTSSKMLSRENTLCDQQNVRTTSSENNPTCSKMLSRENALCDQQNVRTTSSENNPTCSKMLSEENASCDQQNDLGTQQSSSASFSETSSPLEEYSGRWSRLLGDITNTMRRRGVRTSLNIDELF